MPRVYERKSFPVRHCLRCRKSFNPSRDDNMFCSHKDKHSCLSLMITRERSVSIAHVKAVVAQEYKCWRCHEDLQHIGVPVFLDPHEGSPDTTENIVGACRDCRKAYYLEIVSGASADAAISPLSA